MPSRLTDSAQLRKHGQQLRLGINQHLANLADSPETIQTGYIPVLVSKTRRQGLDSCFSVGGFYARPRSRYLGSVSAGTGYVLFKMIISKDIFIKDNIFRRYRTGQTHPKRIPPKDQKAIV